MNKRWIDIIFVLVIGLAFPSILLGSIKNNKNEESQETTATPTINATIMQTEQTYIQTKREISVKMDNGKIENIELDQYIVGVVLQEMPAEFELEALKAQAVVARTYTLKRAELGNKHTDADICTDPSCCQGFCSPDKYLSERGTQEDLDKINLAVATTSGQVLIYDNKLIEATYFSCSGGMTEDALAVWGSDVPYLQATHSPGEEDASHYTDTVFFSKSEFSDLLNVSLSGPWEEWIETVSYTSGGGVDSICICGKTYTGTQIRKLLGLRSTMFTLTVVGDVVTITTKGFGHRVGMSQYGADAMAVKGSNYIEILAHYYQGAVLAEY